MPRRRPSHLFRATLATGALASGTIATAAVTTLTGYLGLLSAAGLLAGRRPPRTGRTGPHLRFAVLVPAHDEAVGIARALATMQAMDYPRDSFEVHVVADNCTDDTARVVRECGVEVHERHDLEDPGKGSALNWLHDQLVQRGDAFDAFVVIDADTDVDPRFLAAMDDALRSGAEAAQGFYGVRDADRSATAGLRAAALACRHHLRPLGRRTLGGSCGLFGNGMAFRAELLAARRWSGHLTEDLEMQVELLLDGHLVTYVPEARVEAEIPHDLDASVTQHQRWERGRVEVARTSLPRLLRAVIEGRRPRFAHLDAALDQLVPPISVLVAAQGAANAVGLAALVLHPGRWSRRLVLLDAISTSLLVGHVLAGLRSVDAPRSVYRSLLDAPRLVVWKLRLWLGLLGRQSDVSWTRTDRNEPELVQAREAT
jgi:cellulose synthase/poly-beta-1,6-N-acetylglucosamine synthase-like glycosyltransferase